MLKTSAVALALGSLSPAAAQPAQFVVQVSSFSFAPAPIHLAAGKPVTLSFVNRSGSSHDFTAHGFFQNARITAGAAPDGEIDLKPHETKIITLVPAAGSYHAHCSHFLHKQLGMSVEILVS
jgi:plastocyanin